LFHKLPNGSHGLSEWYPTAKSKTEENTVKPRRRKTKATRKAATPKKVSMPTVLSEPIPSVHEHEKEQDEPPKYAKGQMMKSIKDFIKLNDKGFSLNGLLDHIRKSTGVEPIKGSVSSIISKLVKLGSLELVRRKKGRNPAIYRGKQGIDDLSPT
jgi:hypothetical protein